MFTALLKRIHHPERAVPRATFFIAGNQQCKTSRVIRIFVQKIFGRDNHSREPTFHVGRAATVNHPILERWLERVADPLILVSRRHYISMASETQDRT